MKELEKEHIQMKDDYESDDPERIEEANQLNNRVRDATRSPLAHRAASGGALAAGYAGAIIHPKQQKYHGEKGPAPHLARAAR